ncbi:MULTISPECIES: DegT/DnrJ/EryC1/StrS family aminotransferase [Photorhabdus]|uniref:Aminotransferase class I/II-fold pyridoxal phosphate-dependent enzyme n=1 Tax=Photorhabdus kayaii TaxID=230088 RepID=A0ABX0B1S9_9GAMM|nr:MULTISPECIES: DegT/DnrJ/EryC1/StrS family aminotransferase [Photorhabdus]MCC8372657.1 DegT/DnrJ/EryC1/StrS family aminotransferase [Photorhabdus bodei]MCC8466335.1 DegT/DnrJ/EryC1/StrS family aminotransferase [Photorhabdus bodei]MCT8351845.1 DegT/DnrJ/EryC1/StrS family aminotransferase [Photorhabdus kayaii]MDB6367006.1 DegT/DnrJ/EryC1/StrS family aminotransferase [Photorhabdus bodei]NDL12812.1 aminotransferase class I/II-fold pyridoxal phosphate-dependent enzyme [Photorhabdus kayaii]
MNNKFLPFALPEIGQSEIDEVIDSLKTGWITTGPKAKRFEQDFAQYLGSGVEAISVNSATAGLHLALEAIGIQPGDEVIVPTYTFTATAEVVRYLGAHPVFVDSLPDSLNIDPIAIEKAITAKTKAIMPVHFAGLSCDMDAIIAIAKKFNLRIIEDAAHSFPTLYKGKKIGTLDTDVTVFSFYANKTMTTAEGGMLVSRDPDIIKRTKIMRLHGISKDAFDRYQSKIPAWYYEVIEPGYKYNMPDICASIGIHQLQKIDAFQKKREEMAKLYDNELKDLPIILPTKPKEPNSQHAWHLYTIRLNDEVKISRDDFIIKMAEKNIGCSVHFIPLHKQPIWKNTYSLDENNFPVAEENFKRIVSIPLYTKMTKEDQIYVINTIKEILA